MRRLSCCATLLGGACLFVIPLVRADDVSISQITGDRNYEVAPNVEKYETGKLVAATEDGSLPREADGPLLIVLSATSKELRLNLVESDILAHDAKSIVVDDEGPRELRAKNYSYTGTLEGDPGAVVRVSIVGDSLKGVIYASDGEIGIEPLRHYDPRALPGDVLVYRATDIAWNWLKQEELSTDHEELVGQHSGDEWTAEGDAGESAVLAPDGSASLRLAHNRCIYDGAIQGTATCTTNAECAPPATCMASQKQCLRNGAGTGTPCTGDADCADGEVCRAYQVKRLDLGLMGDYDFVLNIHAGNVDAAQADMDSAVNAIAPLFRTGLPRAKGSVPVAPRITRRVTFASVAAQTSANVNFCPTTCHEETTYAPGTPCKDLNDCISDDCLRLPSNARVCGGALAGKFCKSNFDCPGSSCTTNTANVNVCDGGTRDGQLCHAAGVCAQFSDCCTNGGLCTRAYTRAARSAGRYRVASTDWRNNTDTIVRWSGCHLAGSVSINRSCKNIDDGSAVAVEDYHACSDGTPCDFINGGCASGPCLRPTALERFGTLGHEVGHSVGAHTTHDYGSACANLRMGHHICAGGASKDWMCEATCTTNADCHRSACVGTSCSDCPGSTCSVVNIRYCGSSTTQVCIDDDDCSPGQLCGDPAMRVCIDGDRDGLPCRVGNTATCPDGSCDGAPMTRGIYFESGSGILGGFSPCSQVQINDYVNSTTPPACLTSLVCGDVDKSGALNTTDALAANRIAVGTDHYDDLADAMPIDNPDEVVDTADSLFILKMAVGQLPPPTVCGRVNTWQW